MKPLYKQKFRKEWLNHPQLKSWLTEKEVTLNNGKHHSVGYCRYCTCSYNGNKLSDLIAHSTSKKHLNQTNIVHSTKSIDKTYKKRDVTLQICEAECALFTAAHTSMNSCSHLAEIMKKYKSGITCSRTKCTGIINTVLYRHFKEDLQNDIGTERYFSLLLDESTDNSETKFLGVSIIYFSEKQEKVISTYLSLSQIPNGEAKTIVEHTLRVLKDYNLNIKKLRGIGTDNANVMTGSENGVYGLLKKMNPNIILVICLNHSIQLAISKVCEEFMPRSLEYLISQTYNWFSHSSKRQYNYHQLYSYLYDEDPLKITRVCDTRWLSIEPCVTRILKQWDALKLHFQICKTKERCYQAEVLYGMYNDNRNLAYLKFIQPILAEIAKLNGNLQTSEPNHLKILNDLILLIQSWVKSVTLPNYKILHKDLFSTSIEDIKKVLDPKPRFSYMFEEELTKYLKKSEELFLKKCEELKLTAEELKLKKAEASNSSRQEETHIRQSCVQFLFRLIEQFQNRLPANIEILKNIDFFSPENTLTQVKPQNQIAPLLRSFGLDDVLISAIESQWNAVCLIPWTNKSKLNDFWIEVQKYKDAGGNSKFNELCDFVFSLLILPHSNAEVERVFSVMNVIKSKLRNRMKFESLNSILTIRFGLKRNNKCCFNYSKFIKTKFLLLIGTNEVYENEKSEAEQNFDFLNDLF